MEFEEGGPPRDLQDHTLLGEAGDWCSRCCSVRDACESSEHPSLFCLAPALLFLCMNCLALLGVGGGHCFLCALPRHLSLGLTTTYTFSRTHPVIFVLLALATNGILGKAGSLSGPLWSSLPSLGFATPRRCFHYSVSRL